MKRFSTLFEQIDQTQSTNEKVAFLEQYFQEASSADAAWALFFLSGHRLKRFISSKMLLQWSHECIDLPSWLIEEAYSAVGDTAETIALLFPQKEEKKSAPHTLSAWMENLLLPLQGKDEESKKEQIFRFWDQLNNREIFILNKILTGSFRVGVSSLLTLKALSQTLKVPREILSQRVMGYWEPTAEFFESLKSHDQEEKYLNPYPFYLAHPLETPLEDLGSAEEWFAEWKWDGIRAQLVVRQTGCALWSRGNELISEQFPEILEAGETLPVGTVLDGELLAYQEAPLPFGELQKRLGRKQVSKSMTEKVPVLFMIYDILEYEGQDLRQRPLVERRKMLDEFQFNHPKFLRSKLLEFKEWSEVQRVRERARESSTEGIMLKRKSSPYGVGRRRGDWWKYKVDPLTIDAVLLYAQAGSGRRANLFTDYTFAVWREEELIPIAKAYSGLNQKEIDELDRWIKKNTEEKFGPVRRVKPFQLFEIAFEGIQISKRHKSGVALRFPRILRWRRDKPYQEADTLENIKRSFLHEEL